MDAKLKAKWLRALRGLLPGKKYRQAQTALKDRSDFHGITARELRGRLGAKEITSCDIFGRGGFEACSTAALKRESA